MQSQDRSAIHLGGENTAHSKLLLTLKCSDNRTKAEQIALAIAAAAIMVIRQLLLMAKLQLSLPGFALFKPRVVAGTTTTEIIAHSPAAGNRENKFSFGSASAQT